MEESDPNQQREKDAGSSSKGEKEGKDEKDALVET